MSLIFMDGFDHLDDHWYTNGEEPIELPKWETMDTGGGPYGTETGRLGVGRCLPLSEDTLIYQSISPSSELLIGLSVKTTRLPSYYDRNCQLVSLRRGHRAQCFLGINGRGFFEVWRGAPDADDSVLLASSEDHPSAMRMPLDTWMTLEFKVKIHSTAGYAELRVDGEEAINSSPLNTLGQSDNIVNVLRLATLNGIQTQSVDDLYVFDTSGSMNNDFTGGLQINLMVPNGNGASSQWTGSDGNQTDNYLLVDDTVPVQPFSTYVKSYTAGHIDSYAYDSLSFAPLNVRGVMLNALSRRGSVQACKFAMLTRVSSTNYFGHTVSCETLERVKGYLWETNPNTSAAWTKEILDGAEFGIKVI